MAKTRGTGLLMVWSDIDAQHEEDYRRFYRDEHIAHLMKVPGFLNGGLYQALRGGPKYLAMYELEEYNVLRSADFLDTVRYKPSAVRSKASGGHVGRNYMIIGYRQIFPARSNPIENTMEMPRYLQMGRMDIPAAMEEEFNAWYNTSYIPSYLTVPGVIRVRRFLAVENQPKYLTVYEFENPGVPDSPEWDKARNNNPWNRRVRPHLQLDAGSPAVYQRIQPAL